MIKMFEKFNEPKIDISYLNNGQKSSEEWYLNNVRHREDGPAYQRWGYNGRKKAESWWLNGNRHREDGPATQRWFENDVIISFNLNGKEYLREEWIEELKKIGSPHYEEQLLLYNMEKYNL